MKLNVLIIFLKYLLMSFLFVVLKYWNVFKSGSKLVILSIKDF